MHNETTFWVPGGLYYQSLIKQLIQRCLYMQFNHHLTSGTNPMFIPSIYITLNNKVKYCITV